MKNTIILVSVIITFLITWTLFATICYLLSDLSFKQSFIDNGVLMCLMIIGWIPSLIVSSDLIKHYE
jgi:hypothetical protein